MLTLAVLRHASTAWNERGWMQGRRDVPLSERGRAEAAAWRLPPALAALACLSSPLRRATETAELLTGKPPAVVPALVEMDWGQWEGASLDELRARHGAAFDDNASRGLDFRPPGGESPRDVLARIQPWLHEVAQAGEPVLVVTHNGVLRTLLVAATGWPMTGKPPVKLAAGCVHRFGVERDGRIAVVRCNIPLASPPGGSAR